jgi:hypothetical protein
VEPDAAPDVIVLRDGARLVIRSIEAADAEALVALHARLSADTIYRRYFGVRPHLSPADVERFTRVDGRTRFALVAVRGSDLVAVTRYEGRPGESSAEIAVVVDDALQHQGVGRPGARAAGGRRARGRAEDAGRRRTGRERGDALPAADLGSAATDGERR